MGGVNQVDGSRLDRVGAWRSLVSRSVWGREVPGSNPGAPIIRGSAKAKQLRLCRLRPGAEARRGYVGGGKDLREQIGGEFRTTAAATGQLATRRSWRR